MPFADDYQITQYVNEDVTPTGTPDLSAENLLNTENGVKELYTALSALYASHEDLEADVAAMAGSAVVEDTTFITGLKLEWASTTQIRVTSGFCYVPSAGEVATLAANTTLTINGLGANTWYYIYAMNVAGNVSLESSTTVPVIYRGTARQKTGDASRRFLGAYRTNGSSQIMRFIKGANYTAWLENLYVAPLWVAGTGHATQTFGGTTQGTISLAAAMPVHSQLASLLVYPGGSSAYLHLGNPDDAFTLAYDVALWQDNNKAAGEVEYYNQTLDPFPTDASQQINYLWSAGNPPTTRHMFVRGYYEER